MTLIFKKELESIESSVDAFNDSGRARRRAPQKRQYSYLVTIFGTAGNSTRDGRN
jgi:hypothetical protein